MICYCFLRNVVDLLDTGLTPYETRFQREFKGLIIPFGSRIKYKPSSDKDKSRLHPFQEQLLEGIFLGYDQRAGGDWSEDYLIVDTTELENAPTPKSTNIKRIKEIFRYKDNDKWYFPLIEGDLIQPGDDEHTRRRNEILKQRRLDRQQRRDRQPEQPPTTEKQDIDNDTQQDQLTQPSPSHQRDSDPTQSDEERQREPPAPTHPPDTWQINNDVLIRIHSTPRTKLFQPDEVDCPIPTKYLDVMRRTETDTEHLAERHIRDYWFDDGPRDLSEPWTGRTIFNLLRPEPPHGYIWIDGRLTKKQATTRPDSVWPETWRTLSAKNRRLEIEKWEVIQKERNDARQRLGLQPHIRDEDVDHYTETLASAKLQYSIKAAPAMPLASFACNAFPTSLFQQNKDGLIELDTEQLLHPNDEPRPHQDKVAPVGYTSTDHFAMVHTPVPLAKAMRIPLARESIDKEWNKLDNKLTWDFSRVQPKQKVIADARQRGVPVHFGDLMILCHIKHSELAEHLWRYKGRIVFRGDNVKDESGFLAVFSEQGASASHMAAAKFMDAIARLPACHGEVSDAIGAYHQVLLAEGESLLNDHTTQFADTWITIPKSRQPASWANIEKPVVPLLRNLYGHPLAGLLWERHCRRAILKHGFEPVKGWECLYVHRKKQLFLSVYVDDFKMAGNSNHFSSTWRDLRQDLDLDPPVQFNNNTYLGCTQRDVKLPQSYIEEKNRYYTKLIQNTQHIDPAAFDENKDTQPNITAAGPPHTTDKQSTPNQSTLHHDKHDDQPDLIQTPTEPTKPTTKTTHTKQSNKNPEVRAWTNDMIGHCEQAVERYCELANMDLTQLHFVHTPCIDDHQIPPEDFLAKGILSPVAARIVLKALYLARIGRPDALWAVNYLAREVTKWTIACDKRLHRLMCYLHHHQDWTQHNFVGNYVQDTHLAMFVDASFADDLRGSKSTTGGLIAIVGSHTFVPITWVCKKQGAVSHSSTEAEVIALEACLRMEGLPCLNLWDLVIDVFDPLPPAETKTTTNQITLPQQPPSIYDILSNVDYVPPSAPLPRPRTKLVIFEDNDSVIKISIKGRSPNLRHVLRTQRIDLDWLYERLKTDTALRMRYCPTKEQIADIFTKGTFISTQWQKLCHLAQLGPAPPNLHDDTPNTKDTPTPPTTTTTNPEITTTTK